MSFAAALSSVRRETSAAINSVMNGSFEGIIVDSLRIGATPWPWQVPLLIIDFHCSDSSTVANALYQTYSGVDVHSSKQCCSLASRKGPMNIFEANEHFHACL